MSRIVAITQRVVDDPGTGERRDCLDQRWAPFLEQLGCQALLVPNGMRDAVAWLRVHDCSGLILTGGNDLAHLENASEPSPERDQTESELIIECRSKRLPIIGVCRGMQMINHVFGGEQRRCQGHVAINHALRPAPGASQSWQRSAVNSYHDWGMTADDLGPDVQPLALTDDDMVEAFRIKDQSIWGLMWHPERETPINRDDIALFEMMLGRQTD